MGRIHWWNKTGKKKENISILHSFHYLPHFSGFYISNLSIYYFFVLFKLKFQIAICVSFVEIFVIIHINVLIIENYFRYEFAWLLDVLIEQYYAKLHIGILLTRCSITMQSLSLSLNVIGVLPFSEWNEQSQRNGTRSH